MKTSTGSTIKYGQFAAFLTPLFLMMFLLPTALYAVTPMQNYCLIPPYVKKDVKPNILIILDNAYVGGSAAYPAKINNVATQFVHYDPNTTYEGLFKSGLTYTYSTSGGWSPNSSTGLSGNILNWAATSKYDLVESVLIGGKSVSRQTNINNLLGLNEGSSGNTGFEAWVDKTLNYTGTDNNPYTCIFKVNVGARGKLTITETAGGGCGLLNEFRTPSSPNIYPRALNPNFSFKEAPDKRHFAIAEERNDRPGSVIIGNIGTFIERLLSLLESDAEAGVSIHNPGGASLPSATDGQAYSFTCTATGVGNNTAVWSASGLPTGLSIGASSGIISGTVNANCGTYNGVSITVTAGSAGTSTWNGYIVVGSSLAITMPPTNGSLGTTYQNQGFSYTATAAGGRPAINYTWSQSGLPTGLSIAANASGQGIISGSPTADVAVSTTTPVTLTVNDGHCSASTGGVSITQIPRPVALTITYPANSAEFDITRDVAIAPIASIADFTNGTETWSAIALPPGLSIAPATGLISGTPTTTGTYPVTICVKNLVSPLCTAGQNQVSITFVVAARPVVSKDFDIQVCAGNYSLNCSSSSADLTCSDAAHRTACDAAGGLCDASNNCVLKKGIISEFWSQAQWGEMDFTSQLDPKVSICVPANNDNNYYNAIENAIWVGDSNNVTKLIDGIYTGVQMYQGALGGGCDPYAGDTQSCRKNFMLLLTPGMGATVPTVSPLVFSTAGVTQCNFTSEAPAGPVHYNISKNSCYGSEADLRTTIDGRQYVSTYVVHSDLQKTNEALLRETADLGGGSYYDASDPTTLRARLIQAFQDIIKRAASGTAASVLASGEGSGANLIQAVFYPRKRFRDLTTGTEDEIAWIGRLTNFWYYVDPFFGSSSIFEDSGIASPNVLNLFDDNKISLHYDSTLEKVMADRWLDSNHNGIFEASEQIASLDFESLKSLWEAGIKLWGRDISADKRKIYTTINGTSLLAGNFSRDANNGDSDNSATLAPFLQAADAAEASNIIRYIHGEDITDYRSRTVSINRCSNNQNFCSRDTDCDGGTCVMQGRNVWKLGDVLNSTPKISSWVPLVQYHKTYNDATYGVPGRDSALGEPVDATHYITTNSYKNRGMVFAGGNDGMLHAIKLGTLELTWTGQQFQEKARMTGTDMGKEIWAFIPKNALPYLIYQKDPDYGSCHVYTVDLTPYVFDASIGVDAGETNPGDCAAGTHYWSCKRTANTWRTILIGGMRFGGACKNSTASCTTDLNGDGVVDDKDCVKTPIADTGYSSYFALDVTDQNNPTLLWEFSNPALGYATTGPAVVKIKDRKVDPQDSTKSIPNEDGNGRWFVVFGSGPTGPIDTDPAKEQFLGRSDQHLKLFILDLATGLPATTGSRNPAIDTGIADAFAGSMLNASFDATQTSATLRYQDDVIYVPYVRKCTAADVALLHPCTLGTWTDGGVLRLQTNKTFNSATPTSTALYPDNWAVSTVIDGTGPVTSSIVKLQSTLTNKLWLYFGAGRYYFEEGPITDDATTQRQLFGIMEPCFTATGFTENCATSITNSVLTTLQDKTCLNDQACADAAISAGKAGWRITLDAASGPYRAERVITDPLATTFGVVFFTTYKPYSDECSLGGKSLIWAIKFDTGGSAGAILKGKALVQVSTGSIEELDLSTSTFVQRDSRRSGEIEGVPPTAQGLSILSSPPAVKRVIHMRER